MPEEYTTLFNAITDALAALAALRSLLEEAQQRAEELYITRD